jgi:hypothetical protein
VDFLLDWYPPDVGSSLHRTGSTNHCVFVYFCTLYCFILCLSNLVKCCNIVYNILYLCARFSELKNSKIQNMHENTKLINGKASVSLKEHESQDFYLLWALDRPNGFKLFPSYGEVWFGLWVAICDGFDVDLSFWKLIEGFWVIKLKVWWVFVSFWFLMKIEKNERNGFWFGINFDLIFFLSLFGDAMYL